ncbi:MAG: hypothetical protein DCO97_21415 [Marivita sp. XM-24bin2]|nr:MAG: hypothetical protein DCO97_21415 [Marivita sp. XM-24bin2]
MKPFHLSTPWPQPGPRSARHNDWRQSLKHCNNDNRRFFGSHKALRLVPGRIRHRTKRIKGCLSRHGMLHMMFKLGQCAEKTRINSPHEILFDTTFANSSRDCKRPVSTAAAGS